MGERAQGRDSSIPACSVNAGLADSDSAGDDASMDENKLHLRRRWRMRVDDAILWRSRSMITSVTLNVAESFAAVFCRGTSAAWSDEPVDFVGSVLFLRSVSLRRSPPDPASHVTSRNISGWAPIGT